MSKDKQWFSERKDTTIYIKDGNGKWVSTTPSDNEHIERLYKMHTNSGLQVTDEKPDDADVANKKPTTPKVKVVHAVPESTCVSCEG